MMHSARLRQITLSFALLALAGCGGPDSEVNASANRGAQAASTGKTAEPAKTVPLTPDDLGAFERLATALGHLPTADERIGGGHLRRAGIDAERVRHIALVIDRARSPSSGSLFDRTTNPDIGRVRDWLETVPGPLREREAPTDGAKTVHAENLPPRKAKSRPAFRRDRTPGDGEIDALLVQLQSGDIPASTKAARALAGFRMQAASAVATLSKVLVTPGSDGRTALLREACADALAAIGSPSESALQQALEVRDDEIRLLVLETIIKIGSVDAIGPERVTKLLDSKNSELLMTVLAAVPRSSNKDLAAAVAQHLDHSDELVREAATKALSRVAVIGNVSAEQLVANLARRDERSGESRDALEIVKRMKKMQEATRNSGNALNPLEVVTGVHQGLEKMLRAQEMAHVNEDAYSALRAMGEPAVDALVAGYKKQQKREVRMIIVRLLAEIALENKTAGQRALPILADAIRGVSNQGSNSRSSRSRRGRRSKKRLGSVAKDTLEWLTDPRFRAEGKEEVLAQVIAGDGWASHMQLKGVQQMAGMFGNRSSKAKLKPFGDDAKLLVPILAKELRSANRERAEQLGFLVVRLGTHFEEIVPDLKEVLDGNSGAAVGLALVLESMLPSLGEAAAPLQRSLKRLKRKHPELRQHDELKKIMEMYKRK